MNDSDKPRDARDTSASTDASHNGTPRQSSTPLSAAQAPHTSSTSATPTAPNLGNSLFTKRKSSVSPVLQEICKPKHCKKIKIEDVSMDEGDSLFVQEDEILSTDEDESSLNIFSADSSTVILSSMNRVADLARKLRQLEAEPSAGDSTEASHQIDAEPRKPGLMDSASADDSMKGGPYDVNVEKRTSGLTIDDPSVQKLERMLKLIVDCVLQLLGKYDNNLSGDKVIQNSRHWLKDIDSTVQCLPRNLTVAAMGDPGSGKSSTISNLLNLPQAAASHGRPSSCTNVRIEYIHHQSALVTAVVHVSDDAKIRKTIQNHVNTMLASKAYNKRDLGDEYVESVAVELKERRKASLDYFESLLVVPNEEAHTFQSRSDLEECIDSEGAGSAPLLAGYVCKFLKGRIGNTRKVRFEASDIKELKSIRELLKWAGSKTDPGESRAIWRLVDKISIFVSSLVLENETGLEDVPGIDKEEDQTRDDTGQAAFHACDTIMIVHAIHRCAIDPSLRKKLVRCALEDKNVMLVLTKLDELGLESEWSDVERSDLSDLVEMRSAARKSCDKVRYDDVEKQVRERLFQLRTDEIRETMQKVYRDLQLLYNGQVGKELSVFPVSNSYYDLYMAGYDPWICSPSVGIASTGIVKLRTAIRNLPAEMKLRALLMDANKLERLLIGIHIYLTRSKLEWKRHVMGFVRDPVSESERQIKRDVEALKGQLRQILTSAPVDRACIDAWKTKGNQLSENWATEHANVYKAICVRRGNYKSHKWNEDISAICHHGLFDAFEKVLAAIGDMESRLPRTMIELLEGITKKLRGKSSPLSFCMLHPC